MTGNTALADVPQVLLSSRFEATESGVRNQITKVSVLLDSAVVDPDRFNDMLMVIGEVLNNIVEHGCANVETAEIGLTVLQSRCNLLVETEDQGPPLPPSLLQKRDPPSIDVPIPDLPEGGFGWFMIHTLVDNMTYERRDGRNLLSFSFELE